MPKTLLIQMCDREADSFELFDEQPSNAKAARVHLLVRVAASAEAGRTGRRARPMAEAG